MWIKTQNQALLNLDNFNCVFIEQRYGKIADAERYAVYANDNIIGFFETKNAAQEYINKLAFKLGAEEI